VNRKKLISWSGSITFDPSGLGRFARIMNHYFRSLEGTKRLTTIGYGGVSKSFRTGCMEGELQMVQLSATRCSCIAILWISLVRYAAINPLCCFSKSVCCCSCLFLYRLSPETFGYILVCTGWATGSHFPARPDRFWNPPCLLSKGYREIFKREKGYLGVKLTTHL
jgi:hypothetical protein